MTGWVFFGHLAEFSAPVLFVAFLLALLGPWATKTRTSSWLQLARWRTFFVQLIGNSITGFVVLFAALWWFSSDGRMLAWSLCIGVQAFTQLMLQRFTAR